MTMESFEILTKSSVPETGYRRSRHVQNCSCNTELAKAHALEVTKQLFTATVLQYYRLVQASPQSFWLLHKLHTSHIVIFDRVEIGPCPCVHFQNEHGYWDISYVSIDSNRGTSVQVGHANTHVGSCLERGNELGCHRLWPASRHRILAVPGRLTVSCEVHTA